MNEEIIAEAIHNVLIRMEEAAKRSDRKISEITLIAASKTVGFPAIQMAASAGVAVFGENRVQEAMDKFPPLSKDRSYELHLIGSLQMNKVKKAVGFFDLIHSIDSIPLAEKVDQEAERQSRTQPVLVQVNIGDEASKGGIAIADLPYLIDAVRKRDHLKLLGLMAIPPQSSHPRPYFAKLRALGTSFGLTRLSMGMSSDFEAAIEEGATWVRVGTAIFGTRV
ncbi:MAG: YggS family pyridoxal phosphate-dependent enzyme [Nitrospirota bacterium]